MSNESPYVNVDPKALIKASETVEEPKHTIKAALDRFNNSISGLPTKPWGKDEIGLTFEVVYEGYEERYDDNGSTDRGHHRVLGSLSDLVDGLQNMSDKTRQMGEDYIANEVVNSS